jgi:predicted TIM-barrel fold metal-dependent hydrolase
MSVQTKTRRSDLGSSVAFRRLMSALAKLLGVPARDQDILVARGKAARDFGSYVGRLFMDAKIRTVAIDSGIEPVPYEEFQKYAPVTTRRIFRIEPLIKRLLEKSKNYTELVNEFESEAKSAVRNRGFSGFKTVIAYRTGLDIAPSQEARARSSFKDGRKDRAWFGPKVKPLRDYLVNVTAEVASNAGAFLQIHTGLGDTDILGDRCNPLLLQEFLKQEHILKTPIALIHGGFPYTKEAAWLCSMFPNLRFELSSPFPPTFIPALSKERFADVLEIVPTNRIVYGSDAIETPEFHWFSAKLAKQALAGALDDLVTKKVMNEEEAYRVADKVLNANSQQLLA